MDAESPNPTTASNALRLSRRRLLRQSGAGLATAVATGLTNIAAQEATPAGTGFALAEDVLRQFEADIDAAMATFQMVGAAVALVDRSGIRYQRGFGFRNQASGTPVTPDTHFLVASTTKSMSSLLVATFVDDGALNWDQPVREVWPGFRAPTDELTKTLRVRDLLGMASGIGEPPEVSAFHQGDYTAGDVLHEIAALPVTDPSNTKFFYNNTVYAVGGYLPALMQGATEDQLATAYARLMVERVYRPSGMLTARLTDDPRPFVTDYATGYAPDLKLGTAPQPYGPVGGYIPVGGTLASLKDMAAYVTMQLNRGKTAKGNPVVSAANLAQCWQPHIDMTELLALEPYLTSVGYGMGWISQTYRNGPRLVWHNGGIDGFSTFIGFFPEEDLGLVILTNIGPFTRGLFFAPYVLNLLVNARFGLKIDANKGLVTQYQAAEKQTADLAAQTKPVDPHAIAPYLGYYEKGWRLILDADGGLRLHQGSRVIQLLAMPDGSYVMASGILPGNPVRFSRDDAGMPRMEIQQIETVRWSSGPA